MQAQETTVWSATLTAGVFLNPFNEFVSGYTTGGETNIGALSDTTFTLGGAEYEIHDLHYTRDDFYGSLQLVVGGQAELNPSLALRVGTVTYQVSAADVFPLQGPPTFDDDETPHSWDIDPTDVPSWSIGQEVAVALVLSATPAPSAPAGLEAAGTYGGAELSWKSSGDSSITSYQYRSRAGTRSSDTWSEWTAIAGSGATTTSHTVTDLTNRTLHTFEVRAVNANGNGAASRSWGTPGGTLWTSTMAVGSGMDGSSNSVLGYSSALSIGSLTPSTIGTSTVAQLAYVTVSSAVSLNFDAGGATLGTDDVLQVGTNRYGLDDATKSGNVYTWSGAGGHGLSSGDSVSVKLESAPPLPGAPGNFQATAGNTQVALGWDNPDDGTITKYQYRVGTGSPLVWSPDWTDITGSGATTTSYTVTGLTNGTRYRFEVRAVNETGEGPRNLAFGTPTATPDTTAPQVESAIVDRFDLVLTYDEPLDGARLATPPTGAYRVTVAGSTVAVVSVTIFDGDDIEELNLELATAPGHGDVVRLSYTVPAKFYKVRDLAGNEANSFTNQPVTNSTPPPAPIAPANLAATPGNAQVTLRWDNPNNSTITKYQYRVGTGDPITWSPDWTDITGSGATTTSQTVTGLTNGTAYTFEVRAVNSTGNGSESRATATPVAALDNTPPQLVSATVNGATLVLTYNEALDATSTPATGRYSVTAGSSTVTVSNVSIGGSAVTLTLGTAVKYAEAVRLTYTVPTADPVQDSAGNDAGPLSNRTVTNNTPAPVVNVSFGEATYTVLEGNRVTVTVTLNADPERSVVIPLTTTNLGGATGSDYSGVPNSVTFNSGQTERTFSFSATQDAVDDDDESVRLGFGTLPTGVSEGTPSSTTVSITDDDVGVSFGQAAYTVAEGSSVTVTVTLSADPERTVTIPITRTNQGGASSGDYSGVPASVTFNSGDTSKTFDVAATDDTVDDDDESVKLGFGSLPAGVGARSPSEATVSITDDDDPAVTVRFGATFYRPFEGESATVTVTLSADPERTVVIPLTTTNLGGATNADYSGVPASVTFDAGETSKTFDVAVTDDTVDDDGEGVQLGLGTLPSGVTAGSPATTTVLLRDNDVPEVNVSFGEATYTVGEGSRVTVTVRLSADPERTVVIPLTTTNQGGATSADYSGVPTGVTFNSGQTERTFSFAAIQDAVDDDGESVDLAFGTLPERVTAGSPSSTRVSITDDDVVVTFGQAAYTVAEGSSVTVTVTLNSDPERTVTIPIRRTNQGGAGNADYSGVPASVTFDAGETSKTFDVAAADDTVDDDDESVKLGFGSLPTGVLAGTPNEATVNITDDDDPEVTVKFGRAAYTLGEGSGATVTVTLSADPERRVVIPVTTTNQGGATSADYSGVPASVTFDAGETSKVFDVAATQDTVDDDDESVLLGFGTLPERVTAGSPAETTVNITDDDVPQVNVSFGEATYDVDEGSRVTVTVTLSADPERRVTVPVTKTERGGATSGDYSGVPDNVVFNSGQMERTFSLAATQDTDNDDGESVLLGFGTLPDGVTAGSRASATVSIADDDHPEVTVTFGEAAYSAAEGGSVVVTVTLSADPERDVTIPLTATRQNEAGADDYSGIPAELSFTDGGALSASFTFTAVDDAVDDDGESVRVTFGTLPARMTRGTPGETTLNITDDDGAGVVISEASLTIDEGADDTYTVVLGSQPTAAVTVTPRIASGGGFTFSPSSLVFTDTNWNSTQTVTVDGTQDDDAVDDTGVISHSVSSTDSNYNGITVSSVAVEVIDDEDVPVTVRFERGSYDVSEGGSTTVKVLLDTDPERTVSVPIVTLLEGGATSGDYSGVPSTVTFSSGETESTFTFTAVDDDVDDDGEGVRLDFGQPSDAAVTVGSPEQATIRIGDNDDPAVTVSFGQATYTANEGSSVTVMVVLSADPERTVVIPLTTTNRGGAVDADYSGVPASVTFNSGQTERTFSFSATQDRVSDGGEAVALGFGTLPSRVTAGAAAVVEIADDDTRGVRVEPTQLTFTEGGSGRYTVVLNTQPTGAVTVTVNDPTDNIDVTAAPDSLTFTPENWNSPQTVTVTALRDSDEDDDTATVTHGVSGGDYDSVSAADVAVTVTEQVRPPTPPTTGGGGGGFGGTAATAPSFVDGFRTTRPLPVNAQPGDAVGDPVVATHPDDDVVTYTLLSGADSSMFTVDAETGQIRLKEEVTLALGQTFSVTLSATDRAGFGALIIVVVQVEEPSHHRYDLNRNGIIERNEVFAALRDYFDLVIERDLVIEVVRLYFAAGST